MTSPNYPDEQHLAAGNISCVRKINAPTGKIIRAYVTDLNTDTSEEHG